VGAGSGSIRNFIGRCHLELGSMDTGFILVADDGNLGPLPIASVNLPLHTAAESRAVAPYLMEAWNSGLR